MPNTMGLRLVVAWVHFKMTIVIHCNQDDSAISMARAIDDPELSEQILANAAAALKDRIPHDRE